MKKNNIIRRILTTQNILVIVVLLVLTLLPLGVDRRVLNIAILSLMYIGLGASWNMLSGMTGIFSIAHAIFFGIGVYSVTIVSSKIGLHPLVGVVLGLVMNFLMASLVGYIGSKLSGLYFTMALIGLSQALYTIATQWFEITGGSLGLSVPKMYILTRTQLFYLALFLAVFSMSFYSFIRSSKIGTNFVAIRENPNLALALGSNIYGYRILSAIFSASMASLCGAFYAIYMMANNPEVFAGVISLKIIMVVVVGGIGSNWAPIAGIFMVILDELVRGAMPSKFAPFSVVTYAMVLILMILLRPDGVVGIINQIIEYLKRKRKNKPDNENNKETFGEIGGI